MQFGFLLDLVHDNYFFYTLVLFVFGACVGSFLNVCIYRLPEENKSIVKPNSYCPHCKTPLKWYDNIPILGYMLLKGRCRYCKEKISIRYIFVEVLTAYIFVEYALIFGETSRYLLYTLFTSLLIVLTFIDIKYQIIPDEINIIGMVAGLGFSAIFPQLQGQNTYLMGFLFSFLGLLVGGGIVYLVAVLGELAFKKEAMGGGDIKLMAMIGAILGWKLALLTFFIAPFFGSIIGLYVKYVKKEDIIPYGPFLALASITALFWGNEIITYLIGRY